MNHGADAGSRKTRPYVHNESRWLRATTLAPPGGIGRILFIDDEPSIAKMSHQTIESLGYDVTIRTSSIEALELFKAKPDGFDLIITDMTMPHMTGEKLAKEMIRLKPSIPVILCTGFSRSIDEEKIRETGIRAVLSKPFLKQKLAETIRNVLDDSKKN